MKTRQKVPIPSMSRYCAVLSGNAKWAIMVKAKALKPKPLRGKAVAVPRCCGQLVAETLIAPEKAEQLPMPVKKPKKHKVPTLIDPAPLLYAEYNGK